MGLFGRLGRNRDRKKNDISPAQDNPSPPAQHSPYVQGNNSYARNNSYAGNTNIPRTNSSAPFGTGGYGSSRPSASGGYGNNIPSYPRGQTTQGPALADEFQKGDADSYQSGEFSSDHNPSYGSSNAPQPYSPFNVDDDDDDEAAAVERETLDTQRRTVHSLQNSSHRLVGLLGQAEQTHSKVREQGDKIGMISGHQTEAEQRIEMAGMNIKNLKKQKNMLGPHGPEETEEEARIRVEKNLYNLTKAKQSSAPSGPQPSPPAFPAGHNGPYGLDQEEGLDAEQEREQNLLDSMAPMVQQLNKYVVSIGQHIDTQNAALKQAAEQAVKNTNDVEFRRLQLQRFEDSNK